MEKNKIGILTLYKSYNYGAVLQAFATYRFLEGKNYEVKLINYQNKYEKKYNKLFSYRKNLSMKDNLIIFLKNTVFGSYKYCKKSFQTFISKMPATKEIKNKEDIELYNFGCMVAGSDQIWNPNIFGGEFDPYYFLNFTENIKKISYASSIGSYEFSQKQLETVKELLDPFSHISVREEFAKKELLNVLDDKSIEIVSDPTMLLSKEYWSEFAQGDIKIQEPYILVYLMSKYEEYEDIIIEYAAKHHLKIALVCFSDIKRKKVDYYLRGLTPSEFLNYIKNASIVMTNSFHGTVFSIIFNKDFYSLYFSKNPTRVENLLKKFELEDRIVREYNDVQKVSAINKEKVDKKYEEISQESRDWFINAIEE